MFTIYTLEEDEIESMIDSAYGKAKKSTRTRYNFETDVISNGYTFRPEYIYRGVSDKVALLCPNNKSYNPLPKNFINGSRCKCCFVPFYKSVGPIIYKSDEYIKSLEMKHSGTDIIKIDAQYKFESIVICSGYSFRDSYNYVDGKTHCDLVCPKGTLYSPMPHTFVHGRRCGCCSGTGGFDKSKPANLYIQKLTNSVGEIISYKYGITNRASVVRMSHQNHKSIFNHEIIFERLFEFGNDAYEMELGITHKLKNSFVDKIDMLDGYTETINPKDLHILMEIVRPT